ncbi:hypothetical protein EDD15DRAFT_2521618 [Pisolithus albus]|nr:hypothetical protein EDD15DRAFT_2521618 [Pisolithus albus]
MRLSKQKSREAGIRLEKRVVIVSYYELCELDETLESAQLDCAVRGRWCFAPGYGGGEEGSYAGGGSASSLDIISKLFVGRELPCREGALRRSIQMVSISNTVDRDDTEEKVDIPKPAITRSGINQAGTANCVALDDELVGGFITFQCHRKSSAAVGQRPVPQRSQSQTCSSRCGDMNRREGCERYPRAGRGKTDTRRNLASKVPRPHNGLSARRTSHFIHPSTSTSRVTNAVGILRVNSANHSRRKGSVLPLSQPGVAVLVRLDDSTVDISVPTTDAHPARHQLSSRRNVLVVLFKSVWMPVHRALHTAIRPRHLDVRVWSARVAPHPGSDHSPYVVSHITAVCFGSQPTWTECWDVGSAARFPIKVCHRIEP